MPEKILPVIPDTATKAYIRQHKTTGLQAPYEGPFDIEGRLSRSTVKLHVGNLKDGTKRFEIHHINNLKFTHPESLASPIHRPSRGRPASGTSVPPDASSPNEDEAQTSSRWRSSNRSDRLPNPPSNQAAGAAGQSKQTSAGNNGTTTSINHATSNQGRRGIASEEDDWRPITGPPAVTPFSRPARPTRNPNPKYVDAIWSATSADLQMINNSISGRST